MDTMADDLLSEIQAVGTEIELLRSASENLQDYIPLLRWLPNNAKRKRAQGLRERRDGYLDQLMQRTRGMIEKGTDNSCVASAIYKDEENKLNDVELKSVCLSLVSGGFSTLAGTLTSCIGSLSTAEGQEWQDMAYEDIKRHYSSVEDAWSESFQDERSPVLNAIIHEATRYYTISAMNLPRKAVTEIDWDGAKIPPKTMILVNLQAANHDTDHFGPNANNFSPARFLNPKFLSSSGPLHFSFGAGSRACSGQILAHRLMYTALLRILSVFRIEASKAQPPETNYIEYNASKSALVAVPKEFNVRLVVRDAGVLNRCLAEAERRTAPGREDM
ncbi:MAG: hypothetical protein M1820_002587 [Bogoriella megaspora]|nr:MAG: hypothetical protein M1820_002587 [Bogoriella megaspora]